MRFLGRWLSPSLRYQVARDHRQTPREFRRRQVVTLVFVVIGGAVLALSLRIEPGSSAFILATLGLAAVWAVGAFASGPLHLGRIDLKSPLADDAPLPRPVVQPILLGVALAAVFALGGVVVHEAPFLSGLDRQVTNVLTYADLGAGPLVLLVTVLNGIAEEMFFRGAVYAAIPRRPEVWTTVIYVIATAATGNVMLAFAAIVVGAVVALQRRASGGILAPILTHITWSAIMLYALPAIFY